MENESSSSTDIENLSQCSVITTTASSSTMTAFPNAGISTAEMLKSHADQSTLASSSNAQLWSTRTKTLTTLLLGAFSFTSMLTSTIVAPLLSQISTDLRIQSPIAAQLAISAYVLAYAFGPFVFAPMSELYGRKKVLLVGSAWFLMWNTLCGFANSRDLLFAARWCSGIGAAASFAIRSGVLADVWPAKQRGRSLGVYTMLPLLGPALGPVVGGILADFHQHSWRWAFWSTSVLSMFLQLIALVWLKETHLPTIQARKARELSKKFAVDIVYDDTAASKIHSTIIHLLTALKRPICLLWRSHSLQLLSLLSGVVFGILYIILSTLPEFFASKQSISIASLHYLALGIGFMIGSQSFAPLADRLYRKSETKIPEKTRLKLLLPATCFLAIGLLVLGWGVSVHWSLADVGLVLIGGGSQLATQCVNAYVIDSFEADGWAASAMASIWGAKSVTGFVLPILAPLLYQKLGLSWASSLLSMICVLIALPVWWTLWIFGEQWGEQMSS